MLGQDSLRSLAQSLGIEAVWKDETRSTNADAIALAEGGAPDLTVVAAGHQTAGRGRLGRSWEAPPGSSLLMSIVLRTDVRPERLPLVSLLVALHLVDACHDVLALSAALKWPNDVVVEDRKLAGVLPEAKVSGGAVDYVVVGLGLNLRQGPEDFPPEIRLGATSAALEGADVSDAAECDLVTHFLTELSAFEPGQPGWAEAVVESARHNCVTLGRDVRATTLDGGAVEGRARDLDPSGGLVLDTAEGARVVAFGEVQHVRPAG